MRTPTCSLHDIPLRSYCNDCKMVVCAECCLDQHKGHSCDLLKNIEQEKREEIQLLVNEIAREQSNLNFGGLYSDKNNTINDENIEQCYKSIADRVEYLN